MIQKINIVLEYISQTFAGRPNTPETRDEICSCVKNVLPDLSYVICDETNNNADAVDCDIYVILWGWFDSNNAAEHSCKQFIGAADAVDAYRKKHNNGES